MKFAITAITLFLVCFTSLFSIDSKTAASTDIANHTTSTSPSHQQGSHFSEMPDVSVFSDKRDFSPSYTYVRVGGGAPTLFVPCPTFSGGLGRRVIINDNALDLSINAAHTIDAFTTMSAQMGYLRYYGNETGAIYLGATAGPGIVVRNDTNDFSRYLGTGTIFPVGNFLLGYEIRRDGKAISFSQLALTPFGLGMYFSFGLGF